MTHPSDEQLHAFAEGISQEAHDHLRGCDACRARVEAYRGAAAALTCASPLSRAYCPPRETLFEAYAPEAAAAPAARLQSHLDACPLCRADVRDLRALEAAPGLAAVVRAELRLLAQLGRGALEVVESSLPTQPLPQPALARGETAAGAGVELRAPFDGGELVLRWAASPRGVDLQAEAAAGAPEAFRLTLGPATGEAVWESRVAEAGQVVLADLAAGRYRLQVFGPRASEPEVELELDLQAA